MGSTRSAEVRMFDSNRPPVGGVCVIAGYCYEFTLRQGLVRVIHGAKKSDVVQICSDAGVIMARNP